MFNNRFNSTKKDPLVEAVQIAMQDGEIRRQAEAFVNEEFGVYSRKAVVREDLAAYDAALEEAYKCMKEGKPNDGNLANNYPPYDKVTRGDVIAGATGKDQMGGKKKMEEKKGCYEEELSPKQKRMAALAGNPKKIDSSDLAALRAGKKMEEEQIDETHADNIRRKYRQKEDDNDHTGNVHLLTRVFGSKKERETSKGLLRKRNKQGYVTGADSAKGYNMTKEYARRMEKLKEEQIDEISKGLALKAMKKSEKRGNDEYDRDETHDRLSDPDTHWDRAKRIRGHMKRKFGNPSHKKDGDSTDLLSHKSYENGGMSRRRADTLTKGPRAGKISAKHKNKLKDNIKYSLGKHKKPNLPEGYELDEAAYSAKAARAGKDIGKPGKMFSKIASKAGERYGSEERGKKVAGAILKRIRAKHMREESDAVSPKNDTESKGIIRSFDPDQNAAKEVRKGLEGSKGEIRDPKSDPNKYPGL